MLKKNQSSGKHKLTKLQHQNHQHHGQSHLHQAKPNKDLGCTPIHIFSDMIMNWEPNALEDGNLKKPE